MYEQFKIRNHTAFAHFWNLANTIQAFAFNLKGKENENDEKSLKKATDYVECLNALGKVAFGESEYREFKKGNKDVPYIPKSGRVKKG